MRTTLSQPKPSFESKEYARTTSVILFCDRHRITLSNKEHWYPVLRQLPGHVNALDTPNLRGVPRITNGVMMYIERSDEQVVMVHREWFVYDDPEVQHEHEKNSKQEDKVAKLLAELLA